MVRFLLVAAVAVSLAAPSLARIEPYPASFQTQMMQTNGIRLSVRVGGHGPAVVLLHGFGDTGDDTGYNKALLAKVGKLTMPVLALGAEKSFGSAMADDLRYVANNVEGGIVPQSGHWIMEENPDVTIKLVTEFLAK